jgi:hypothetical protein
MAAKLQPVEPKSAMEVGMAFPSWFLNCQMLNLAVSV